MFGDDDDLDEAVKRLAEETATIDEGNSDATAERLIRDHAPMAAMQLCRLAQSAGSETVRANTARYIVDRALGPVSPKDTGAHDPFQDFLKRVEAAANAE